MTTLSSQCEELKEQVEDLTKSLHDEVAKMNTLNDDMKRNGEFKSILEENISHYLKKIIDLELDELRAQCEKLKIELQRTQPFSSGIGDLQRELTELKVLNEKLAASVENDKKEKGNFSLIFLLFI